MNEKEFDREFELSYVIQMMGADKLLEKLGSDYDENGIPYWEK